jgi:hypothetical protein
MKQCSTVLHFSTNKSLRASLRALAPEMTSKVFPSETLLAETGTHASESEAAPRASQFSNLGKDASADSRSNLAVGSGATPGFAPYRLRKRSTAMHSSRYDSRELSIDSMFVENLERDVAARLLVRGMGLALPLSIALLGGIAAVAVHTDSSSLVVLRVLSGCFSFLCGSVITYLYDTIKSRGRWPLAAVALTQWQLAVRDSCTSWTCSV